MRCFLGLSCLLALAWSAQAQTGISLARAGYRIPENSFVAAPGQVISISVFGIAGRFPQAILPFPDRNGLPTEVASITVDFVQGPLTVKLPIRSVQQTACPASGPCTPATTITLQIPYELNPDSPAPPSLLIREAANLVAQLGIQAVTDDVHIMNTCDQTGAFIGIASEVRPGNCVPIVAHANARLVSFEDPAVPGETLIIWAYGLGALDRPISSSCCVTPDQIPQAVQPFALSFTYNDTALFPLRRLNQQAPSYAGSNGSGLYQVHFVVPKAPDNLTPCAPFLNNFKILLTGPSSSSEARICLR